MIARNHILEIEFIKKTVLPTYRLTHHRPDPLAPSSPARNHDYPSPSKDFFNTLGYKQTYGWAVIFVRLYEALAVKVVLVGVACSSLFLFLWLRLCFQGGSLR